MPLEDQNEKCPTCKVLHQLSWIGDRDCDPALDNAECCFDGGDCLTTSILDRCMCPIRDGFDYEDAEQDIQHIHVTSPLIKPEFSWHAYYAIPRITFQQLGDGVCHKNLNRAECCFDGGDCIYPVACPTCKNMGTWYGDGICDTKYNTSVCCFDGGDCVQAEACRTCPSTLRDLGLANGICDQVLNTAQCCFDGGDCQDDITADACSSDLVHRIGDGICDPSLNTQACLQDGGDCQAAVPELCASCLVEGGSSRLGDGSCDEDLNNFLCCFDGGDCENQCRTCQSFLEPMQWAFINDGICDRFNYHSKCCFDGDDCLTDQDSALCPTCSDYRKSAFLKRTHGGWQYTSQASLDDNFKCKISI